MKVLHLISGGDTGGAKTHIFSLFHGFEGLVDGKIVCFLEDSFYFDAKKSGIDIEVYEQKSRADMSVVDRIKDELVAGDYDLVHCHGARANFIGMFLKRKIKVPMVTTVHSDYRLDFKDNFYKRIIFTSLNVFALKRFKYFIAVSDSFKEMLVDRGFKEENVYTVYNGINMEELPEYLPKEDFLNKYKIDYKGETIVGIMARLDKVKDHVTFIKGAEVALRKNKDLLFLIAGDGPEREELEELVRELKIEDRVYFLGYITDVYSFLNAMDINALTSVSESFPYAVLEGGTMKLPIISTKVGGLVKLIDDGENGYLIDIGDYEAFGERVLDFTSDRNKIEEFGENLYKKIERDYSSKKMAEDHLKIYEAIVNKVKKNA